MDGTVALTTEPEEAARSASQPQLSQAVATNSSLFRVVWRWHFYAGILVSPVLMVMSITGGIYVFKNEIERFSRREMVFVVPQKTEVGYQARVDAAVKAHPGFVPSLLQVRNEPNRATVVTLRPAAQGEASGREGLRRQVNVYVDPYDGRVLGSASGESTLGTFFQTILTIHRTLWAGTTGRVLTELTTCWSIILLITGTYLWWPRRRGQVAGVWTVRWKAKFYTILRDVHALSGISLLPVCGIILVTGLFYTLAVGTGIHKATHAWIGEPEPARGAGGRGGRVDGGRRGVTAETPAAKSLPLDDLIASMRRRYPDRILMASLGPAEGRRGGGPPILASTIRIGAGNDVNQSFGPMVNSDVTLDRATGKILSKKENSETEFFLNAWAYPLHVGSFWGVATKIPWLIACVVLTLLPISGLWMWWERRPRGLTGLPRRPLVQVPRWLIALITTLCFVLPVLGASVILILIGEQAVSLVQRFRGRLAPLV